MIASAGNAVHELGGGILIAIGIVFVVVLLYLLMDLAFNVSDKIKARFRK